MWGNKKPDTPQAAQPEPVNPIINQPPKPAPASWEEKPAMSTDSMRPLSATSDRSSARLGSSLHVKGEISGSEDLLIDGSVEGLIQLDERKLTVGATAKVTADIIAREVVVYGTVKGNLRAKDRIEIKKDGSVNPLAKPSKPATRFHPASINHCGNRGASSPRAVFHFRDLVLQGSELQLRHDRVPPMGFSP